MKRILAILLTFVTILSLCSCSSEKRAIKEEDIKAICELATLKCYYNNVAEVIKKKKHFWEKDRKLWMEYEGVATIGINLALMEVEIKKDKVIITMPQAEILDIQPNRETLNEKSYIYSQDGMIFKNKITTEEQVEAMNQGQVAMKESVQNNTSLFIKAEKRGKELITNYINKLSDTFGQKYEIEWKSIPNKTEVTE